MYRCDSDGLTSTHVSTGGAGRGPGTALVGGLLLLRHRNNRPGGGAHS